MRLFFKGNIIASIKIDKHPSVISSMRVDLKESILRFVEPWYIIEFGRLYQSPVGIIAPAVIAAPKHCRSTGLFPSDGICAMTTDIVKCADLLVLAPDQENGKPSHIKRLISPRFGELRAMSKIQPGLFLKLVNKINAGFGLVSVLITLLKSARCSSSKTSRLVHQPAGTSGSLETDNLLKIS